MYTIFFFNICVFVEYLIAYTLPVADPVPLDIYCF